MNHSRHPTHSTADTPREPVDRENAAPPPAGAIYTCPMHPEVRQDHPGNCPKWGMTLEPLLPELEEGESAELMETR